MFNVLIVGPTGSGKTKLSIKISQFLNLPILNFDTVQFRKYVEILSCSPTFSEKFLAPHFFFNILEPSDFLSLGFIGEQFQNFNQHIAVGGSVFYALNLLRGIPKIEISPLVKQKVLQIGSYDYLKKIDPLTKIHPNDKYRINRRLEILLSNNVFEKIPQKFDSITIQNPDDFSFDFLKTNAKYLVIKILPNLETLKKNIQTRTNLIFENATNEAKTFGYYKEYSKIIGYESVWDFINNKISQETAIMQINRDTIKYAKKQMLFMHQI